MIRSAFFFRPDISELELKLSEHSKKLSNLQQMVQELASKVLESVLSTIKSSGVSETGIYISKISAIPVNFTQVLLNLNLKVFHWRSCS